MSTLYRPDASRFNPLIYRRRSGLYVSASAGYHPFNMADYNPEYGWDFTDTASITHSGGAVSSVAPAWGSVGGPATQGTSSDRPTTGVLAHQGNNALSFDGVNDSLVTTAGQTPTRITVVVVFRLGTTNTVTLLGSSANSGFQLRVANNNVEVLRQGVASIATRSLTQTRTRGTYVVGVTFLDANNGNQVYWNVNGDTGTVSNHGAVLGNSGSLLIGRGYGSEFFNGGITKIAFWTGDNVLSNAALNAVVSGLKGEVNVWSPSNITGLIGDWDFNIPSSLTLSGDNITGVADQSGSGNHLSWSGPTYWRNTGVTINGRNAAEAVASGATLLTPSGLGLTHYTWAMLLRPNTLADRHFNRVHEVGTQDTTVSFRGSIKDRWNSNNTNVSGVFADFTPVVCLQTGASPFSNYADGDRRTDLNRPSIVSVVDYIRFGDTWDGRWQRGLLYNKVLSSNERHDVQDYLMRIGGVLTPVW